MGISVMRHALCAMPSALTTPSNSGESSVPRRDAMRIAHSAQRHTQAIFLPFAEARHAKGVDMKYRRFGRTGWQVGEIGYGMWGMAGWTGSDDEETPAGLQP